MLAAMEKPIYEIISMIISVIKRTCFQTKSFETQHGNSFQCLLFFLIIFILAFNRFVRAIFFLFTNAKKNMKT